MEKVQWQNRYCEYWRCYYGWDIQTGNCSFAEGIRTDKVEVGKVCG
jgi:hypothetical protein